MSSDVDIDVIVVSYRTPDDLRTFADSLRGHPPARSARVWLVNVDPRPEDREVAAELGQQLTSAGLPATVLDLDGNVGYARAVNRAATLGSGRVLAVFNADTWFTENILDECHDALTGHEEWGILGPRQVGADGQITHGGWLGTNDQMTHRGWWQPDRPLYHDVREAVTVSGAAFFVKRSVWDLLTSCETYRQAAPEAEGAFLPTQHYYEETFCALHCRAHGYKVVYYGAVCMVHLWHRSSEPGGQADRQTGEAHRIFVEACTAHGIPCVGGEPGPKRIKFTLGIEDKEMFHWQLPILLESLQQAGLPEGWEAWVVLCNSGREISGKMTHILDMYQPVVQAFMGRDHPAEQSVDFIAGGDAYHAFNRIEALRAVAPFMGPEDLVFLTESDVFAYGDLRPELFPRSNAVYDNWLCRMKPFFKVRDEEGTGVDLDLLTQALGAPSYRPGGVSVFLDHSTVNNRKLTQDCFRFTQVLLLLGQVMKVENPWIAEMPAFSLALHVNGIPYEVIDPPGLTTQNHTAPEIPLGSLYHYYSDRGEGEYGAFFEERWCKQDHGLDDMLQTLTVEDLTKRIQATPTDHAKRFFQLALDAKMRLYG